MNSRFLAAAGLAVFSAYLVGAGINPESRWQVRDFYGAVYIGSEAASLDWTGNYDTGSAGTNSEDWQEATRVRINYFREMAGVPADITFDPSLSAAAQQAALMMSAANQLEHYPAPGWPWYTAAGADAAEHSNLALGTNGAKAVSGYISDFGGGNIYVGHRRWLLYPHTSVMGSGDAPGDTDLGLLAANAIWVVPQSIGERPATRDEFVAWPPRGHVPAPLVFSRWSFSYPEADFSNATVQMEANGQSIPLYLEPYTTSFIGEPTIVWVPDGMDTNTRTHWPLPESDEAISVSIGNVLIGGSPQSFNYTVIIFDPDMGGDDEFPTVPDMSQPVIPTVPSTVTVSSRSWSEGVQGRVIKAVPYADVLGAETGSGMFELGLSAGYPVIQGNRVANGSSAFHLATPDHTVKETLTFKDEFVIGPGPAQLSFASSLAWATETQIASVDINIGSGDNWQSLWSLRGPVDANNTFSQEAIDLSPWTGLTARFRFSYEVDQIGSYWSSTGGTFGWAIDDIALTGTSRITGKEELPANMGAQTVTLTVENTDPTYLQTRDFAFGGRPLNWGPAVDIPAAWHTVVQTTNGDWAQDPVIGWNFGTGSPWTYVLNLGWTYVPGFPWIYTNDGWFFYLRGSMDSGLWMYHTGYGFIYTRAEFGNWFQHAPFDSVSWKQFGG